jgi:rubredoxin
MSECPWSLLCNSRLDPYGSCNYSGDLIRKNARIVPMQERYKCSICGRIYDPAKGDPYENISPGTEFSCLPDTWRCPVCRALKEKFYPDV